MIMENLKVKQLNYNFKRKSESSSHWLGEVAKNVFYASTDLAEYESASQLLN